MIRGKKAKTENWVIRMQDHFLELVLLFLFTLTSRNSSFYLCGEIDPLLLFFDVLFSDSPLSLLNATDMISFAL